MRSIQRLRPVGLLAAALATAAAVSACDRSPTGGGHPDPAAVRLTVGAQVVTVTSTGVQTGMLTLAQGAHAVAVAWLDAEMSPITDLEAGVSLLVVPVAGTGGVGFTANGLFAGTLTASTAGEKVMSVRLMHGGHADFAQNVTFTVQ